MTTALLVADSDRPNAALRFSGPPGIAEITALRDALRRATPAGPVSIDLSEVTKFDTAGAWLMADTLRPSGGSAARATDPQRALIETVTRALPEEERRTVRKRVTPVLERPGRVTTEGALGLLRRLGFLGQTVATGTATMIPSAPVAAYGTRRAYRAGRPGAGRGSGFPPGRECGSGLRGAVRSGGGPVGGGGTAWPRPGDRSPVRGGAVQGSGPCCALPA